MVNLEQRNMMKTNSHYPINDIGHCLMQAQILTQKMRDMECNDWSLCQAFIALADDESTGFLAYAIWRGRSPFVSILQKTSPPEVNHPIDSGASHAQPCWHKARVACDDLPRGRRSVEW
jgi:hypothetical protein